MTNKENGLEISKITTALEIGEREVLIEAIWEDKKNRSDINAGLAMFVAVEPGVQDVEKIVRGTLQQLKAKPKTAQRWAEDFGRVVACVHPGKTGTFELEKISDDTKAYVKAESTRLLEVEEIVGFGGGGKNVIVINNQAVSVEGLVVELVHLVDELVWERFRRIRNDSPSNAFEIAVWEIVEEGIQILPASEEEILTLRKELGEEFSVRLYGSMAIESIPRVMGGVLRVDSEPKVPIDIGLEVGSRIDVVQGEAEKGVDGPVSFGVGVTLGKQLHIGHLLNLGLAELGRSSTGGEQVRLLSNDTAPRLAAMVVKLAESRGELVSEVADRLRKGEIEIAEIVAAYQQRSEVLNGDLEKEALNEVEKGGGILCVVENETVEVLKAGGFGRVVLIRESELLEKGQALVDSVSNGWRNSGFGVARTKRGIKILKKTDKLTATAKMAAFLADGCTEVGGMCFLDGEADSFDAMDVLQSLSMNVDQLAGIGAGIGGSIGSGTKGNMPTMKEVVERFGEETREIMVFMNLTRPMTSVGKPNGREATTFFDFASTEAVFEAMEVARLALVAFKERVACALAKLKDAEGEVTVVTDKKHAPIIERLSDQLGQVTDAQKLIAAMRKLLVIGEDPSIHSVIERWGKKWPGEFRKDLIRLLMDGRVKTNLDLADVVTEMGLIDGMGKRPSQVVEIKSRLLEMVMAQGYAEEAAVEKVSLYQEGVLCFSKRGAPYFGKLESLTRLAAEIDEWGVDDARMMQELILICMARLGIAL